MTALSCFCCHGATRWRHFLAAPLMHIRSLISSRTRSTRTVRRLRGLSNSLISSATWNALLTQCCRAWCQNPGVAGAAGRREFASRGDVIIVGGFSRQAHGLVLRALKYEANPDGWRFTRVRPSPSLGKARILRIFGDNASRSRYYYRLQQLLSTRGTLGSSAPFDLEPLEALAEFLKLPASGLRPLPQTNRPPTTGGSPQVVRVAAGADATPFVVRWIDGLGRGALRRLPIWPSMLLV